MAGARSGQDHGSGCGRAFAGTRDVIERSMRGGQVAPPPRASATVSRTTESSRASRAGSHVTKIETVHLDAVFKPGLRAGFFSCAEICSSRAKPRTLELVLFESRSRGRNLSNRVQRNPCGDPSTPYSRKPHQVPRTDISIDSSLSSTSGTRS